MRGRQLQPCVPYQVIAPRITVVALPEAQHFRERNDLDIFIDSTFEAFCASTPPSKYFYFDSTLDVFCRPHLDVSKRFPSIRRLDQNPVTAQGNDAGNQ